MKSIFLMGSILVASALLIAASPREDSKAEIGKAAPAFSLKDSSGKDQSLEKYKGKYVVLEWTNKDCPFVRKHYGSGNMQSLQKEFTKKGVIWLTICSSAEENEGFLNSDEANEHLKEVKASPTAYLIDADGKVGHLYGARTTPHMYVVDPEGKLIYNGAIDNRPNANPGSIAGATNYVRQALEEAMAGKAVSVPTSQPYGCSVKYGH